MKIDQTIKKVLTKLADARKDSELLDYIEYSHKNHKTKIFAK